VPRVGVVDGDAEMRLARVLDLDSPGHSAGVDVADELQ
jgi:hypothetical protein